MRVWVHDEDAFLGGDLTAARILSSGDDERDRAILEEIRRALVCIVNGDYEEVGNLDSHIPQRPITNLFGAEISAF